MEHFTRRLLSTGLASCFAIAMLCTGVQAQDCEIGVYSTELGDLDCLTHPGPFGVTQIYVVLHVDAPVQSAAYSLTIPSSYLVSGEHYGPVISSTNMPSAGGENVSFGQCVVGSSFNPIRIVTIDLIAVSLKRGPIVYDILTLEPNPDVDPAYPSYTDCGGISHSCEYSSDLFIISDSCVVATESSTWSRVKAMY